MLAASAARTGDNPGFAGDIPKNVEVRGMDYSPPHWSLELLRTGPLYGLSDLLEPRGFSTKRQRGHVWRKDGLHGIRLPAVRQEGGNRWLSTVAAIDEWAARVRAAARAKGIVDAEVAADE